MIYAQYSGGDVITVYGRNTGTHVEVVTHPDGSQNTFVNIDCDNFFTSEICYVISSKPMPHPDDNRSITYAEINVIDPEGNDVHIEGELLNSHKIDKGMSTSYEYDIAEF
ncbi:MAG TPA: hypothetical protein VK027_03720 [Chitinophagaceae bacterium]|nr:hypothetical protein [Chitinophagaceae bacterium]